MAHRVVPSADGLTRRVSHRHRIDAFIWLIAHEVGQLHEALPQRRAKLVGHLVLVNRAAHTPQPFVAFLRANGEGHVSLTEARMPVPFNVGGRSARPAHEIQVELLARLLETCGMQRANLLGLWGAVHQIIKAINEAANAGLATELIEMRRS